METCLAASEPDAALQERVERLLPLLEHEQAEAAHRAAELDKDKKFLKRLEDIRLDRLDRAWQWKRADAAYSTAFREFGIDPDQIDPAEAGHRLAQRSEPLELVFFVDDWASVRVHSGAGEAARRRLLLVAKAADKDPWRTKLRQAEVQDRQTIDRLASTEEALSSQPAKSLLLLANLVSEDRAIRVLKAAWRSHPGDFWICYELGSWHDLRFSTAAVALRPDVASTHYILANALLPSGMVGIWAIPDLEPSSAPDTLDDAIAEYRKAIAVKPDVVSFHRDLAHALFCKRDKQEEAIREYRKSILLDPENSYMQRYALVSDLYKYGRRNEAFAEIRNMIRIGVVPPTLFIEVLEREGRLAEAVEDLREAVRLEPKNAYYLDSLGRAHLARGELKEALASLREAIGYQKGHDYPGIVDRIEHVVRLTALEGRLVAILRGQDVPSDNKVWLDVAELCRAKGLFAAAARSYRQAFQAKPTLTDNLDSQHRLHAAIAAAKAGTELNTVTPIPSLDDKERARWRAQALEWLRAEKDACATVKGSEATGQPQANGPPIGGRPKLNLDRSTLDILTHHRDLACVRDEANLMKLPKEERQAWQAFWAEVAALLKAAGKS